MEQRLRVVLDISAHEFAQYYKGRVDSVVTKTTDGRVIKFPANILRTVVQRNGVHGVFELVLNEHCKFISIKRVGDEP